MKPVLPILATLALLAGSGLQAAGNDSHPTSDREETSPTLPARELTPRLLYRFMLAEIAGQRGQLGVAAETYLELAKETRDLRVVRRATELALHSRRLELALQTVKIWIEIDPNSNQALQTQISLLAAQNQFKELSTVVAGLLAAEPERIGANLTHLNRLFVRSQDRKAVRETVDTLTEPYLQHPEAHFARAQAAFEMRDIPGAKKAIREARTMRPDWEAAVLFHAQLLEDRNEAATILADHLATWPQANEARLAFARTLVSEKRYAEARREFTRLLENGANDPVKHGDTVFAIAVLSLQLGETREAEGYLRRLVEMGHADIDKARFYLGQIAEEGKRWAEALEWFAGVGRGEHYLTARLHAANMLMRLGRLADARRHLAESEVANPREHVQIVIGEAQLLRDAGRIADAHAALVAGLAQQPDQPDLIYETALMAEKLGHNDELESRLRHLIRLKPDHAHAHNALGYSLAERNLRLDEARKLIERALELAPNDPFILDSKGWLLFRQGQLPAAIELLRRAIGIRQDPEIAAHLGEVLWRVGQQDEARATWEKAQREHPGNPVLAETIKRLLP